MTPLRVFHTRTNFDATRVFEKDFNHCLFSYDSWDVCCWCRSTLAVYSMLMLLLPIQAPESRQCDRWSETWRNSLAIMHQKEGNVYKEKQEWEDQGYLFTWMQPKSWMTMSRTSKRIIIYSFTPFSSFRWFKIVHRVFFVREKDSRSKWLRSNSLCDFMITERWCEGGCEDETLVSVRGTEGKPEESEEDYFLSSSQTRKRTKDSLVHSLSLVD